MTGIDLTIDFKFEQSHDLGRSILAIRKAFNMMVSKPVLSALVLLALAAPVIAKKYTQKVDCAPWADGCADAYGEYSPPGSYS